MVTVVKSNFFFFFFFFALVGWLVVLGLTAL